MTKSDIIKLAHKAKKGEVDEVVIRIKPRKFERLAVALYDREYANINIWKLLKSAKIELKEENNGTRK